MAKNQKASAAAVDEGVLGHGGAAAPPSATVDVTQVDLPNDAPPTPQVRIVKARVLVGCSFGKCNDVVEIDAALVESLSGQVDADPAAVEYAESLTK